jgi:hypothetical protein
MKQKEQQKRILNQEEMRLIRGGNASINKPKTPGEIIIQPLN